MNVATLKAYRAQIEDALRIEVEQLAQQLREVEARRACLESEADAAARAYMQRTKSGMSAREALREYEALEWLARSIRQAKDRAALLREEWERKQQALLAASRERRKLELLEERIKRRRRRAAEQQDQRLADEVASRRTSR